MILMGWITMAMAVANVGRSFRMPGARLAVDIMSANPMLANRADAPRMEWAKVLPGGAAPLSLCCLLRSAVLSFGHS